MLPPRFEIRTVTPAVHDDIGRVIANIWTEPLHHVAFYRSPRGTVGGNHFHPDHTEITYLIAGSYELAVLDMDDPHAQRETRLILPGQLVICRPRVAHAHRYSEDSLLLGLADKPKRQEDYARHTCKLTTSLF